MGGMKLGMAAAFAMRFLAGHSGESPGSRKVGWCIAILFVALGVLNSILPGTSMIISSGPVVGTERQAAVINLLKRESMPASHRREEDP